MQYHLETERLILRDLRIDDLNGMFELNSNVEVNRYMGNQPIKTLDEAKENIEFIQQQYLTNGIGRFAVIEKETGAFLGWGGLKLITDEMNGHRNFYELGYRFLPKYWGKGFATEVAKASIAYGFKKLNIAVIYAITEIDNHASKHVLEKVGFECIEGFEHFGIAHSWLKISNPK